ncbi:MAG: ABC-ATPase domain-containing protein [Bacillota bacterium]|nr:ABC-ATPase domain-containing protein [Bacillota bacterium]
MGENKLKSILARIDGKGYKAYKEIGGEYRIGNFSLMIDYVQGDPFASPSLIRIRVNQDIAGFPHHLFDTKTRRVGFQDFITRQIGASISKLAKGNRGTGKSGLIAIDRCGQEILERTSVVVNRQYIEARLSIGLPAAGRRVLGYHAAEMLLDEIPAIVNSALIYDSIDKDSLERQVYLVEDQEFLRAKLDEIGIVSFVANGSVLPRESGISQRLLRGKGVVPFVSPRSLEVTINLPNRGPITGMGIPKGITLIVGGGYHGKSTLLRAIERGVYKHIEGDGREFVITSKDAVKIRAEDGRMVSKVNISPFINNLPNGEDTVGFTTMNASGSTSQAANIIEAVEVGAKVLLLDEDTSATNFMIRDGRMQKLVSREKEPITPFIDRVKQMYNDLGISTVLVVGGSGDYFDVADNVIMLDNYISVDVTRKAKEIAAEKVYRRREDIPGEFGSITERKLLPESHRGNSAKIKVKGIDTILYDRTEIDLSLLEQLVDFSQTSAIGNILGYMGKYIDGKRTLREVLERILKDIDEYGLDVISPFKGHPGDMALPRIYEIAGTLNRMRNARFSQG